MYLAKSSTPDEFLAFFFLGIQKCVRFVEAYDVSTVVQQHSCDWSVSHGHAFQLSALQLRIPREVPMVHCEHVDGHGGVAVSCLELVHHWPFSGLHQGFEDVRICLDHIGIILCPEISAQVAVESDIRRLVVQLCTLPWMACCCGGESRILPQQHVRQDQRASGN